VTAPVRITHPFHPLLGLEINFVERRHNWGEDRVFYRDHHGHLASVPARWTSVEAEDPFVVVAAGRSRFRVADLIDLAALLVSVRSGVSGGGGQDRVRRILPDVSGGLCR
jgi:hypothetical protein